MVKLTGAELTKLVVSSSIAITFGIISIVQGVKTRKAIQKQIHETILSEEYLMLDTKMKEVDKLADELKGADKNG